MLQVADFPIGPLETNCFVIHNDSEAVVVDPGGPPEPVIRYLDEKKLRLTHILLTHMHFDHTCGVFALAKATGARIMGSEQDRYMLDTEFGRGGVWGLPVNEPFDFEPLEPGELPLLGATCKVLATPGHSPGSLSYYFADLGAVFSGDVLFYRSVGRTDFPKGSQPVLAESIRNELFPLPDQTVVYPGHGLATTIGDEKRNNPYISDFSMI